jgi:hypothetical protein
MTGLKVVGGHLIRAPGYRTFCPQIIRVMFNPESLPHRLGDLLFLVATHTRRFLRSLRDRRLTARLFAVRALRLRLPPTCSPDFSRALSRRS